MNWPHTAFANKATFNLSSTGSRVLCCTARFIALILSLLSNAALSQVTYKELYVQYDSAWTFRNLQIVPVRYKSGQGTGGMTEASLSAANRPLSFTEALRSRKIKVREMPKNSADANWLQVTNRSKEDVLIQTGEILGGGKQDRMIGETKMLPPGTTDYLHVYCVEKRRWDDKAKKFKPAGVANSDLQKIMHTKKRQSDVWKEIDRQFAVSRKKSETYSYLELNDKPVDDSDYIRYFLGRYAETDSTFAGYIFITGNRILSTELFASAQLTRVAFRNMLTTYVSTARSAGAPPRVSVARQKEFMDKILTSEAAQKIYVSSHGKWYVTNGKLLHLIAYDD